ncbi:cellobiose transport system substrate-binding protein [Micromonospora phaseoli]|uniref:Cellobiose transport system substrate-binding protein n=1 Tax=Micromonospora phaseoli TaxID=1144548 RepID=A0A1H6S9F4_9ACTN|nr:extracellular solute-binding protein [Micromonospora phaseoli]PZW03694.1 cellobiose-binding protein [Micromonospora phaseoli]GIJ80322.1 sugar ABC transporter substrate-binding protein [Micromonospora phaseoli]SEI60062.1 cellobiose transport system substrate-binding protein [Micromonospora phaseoli]
MSLTTRRTRMAATALAAITAVSGLAACGNDDDTPAEGEKPAKLVVDTFGEMGYDELVKQYEQQTGIKVELRKTAQLSEYRPKLVRYLATGKGAADVTALEEGILNEFKPNARNWADLTPLVADHSTEYLPWKWELGKAPDGRLIGLPTDVGSLAVCYRKDLFEAAGLPTERDAVSALWPDWNGFHQAGRTYKQGSGGKAFIDSITAVSNAVLFQQGSDLFYDKEDNVIADTSPAVKAAWETATSMADISAKAATWSPEWSGGFKQGTFAATFCPSWMLGIVEENSGEANKGKWDVAAVPGGAGNWGGSWLAVPAQSKYPSEAAKLAEFLTNAAGQVAAFKQSGPLPTNLEALKNEEFLSYTNEYFSGAPTGKIFGESVAKIEPVHLGPKHQAVKENAFEPALRAFENGQASKDAAWEQFAKDAKTQGAF